MGKISGLAKTLMSTSLLALLTETDNAGVLSAGGDDGLATFVECCVTLWVASSHLLCVAGIAVIAGMTAICLPHGCVPSSRGLGVREGLGAEDGKA